MKRSASVKRLVNLLGISAEKAAVIRMVWFSSDPLFLVKMANNGSIKLVSFDDSYTFEEVKMRVIDRLLEAHGVEYLGQHEDSKHHVYYCNMGDPYKTTILFHGCNLNIGNWGSLIERNLIKGRGII